MPRHLPLALHGPGVYQVRLAVSTQDDCPHDDGALAELVAPDQPLGSAPSLDDSSDPEPLDSQ